MSKPIYIIEFLLFVSGKLSFPFTIQSYNTKSKNASKMFYNIHW